MGSNDCYKLTFKQELSKTSINDDSCYFTDQDDVVKTATLPGTMTLVVGWEWFLNFIHPHT